MRAPSRFANIRSLLAHSLCASDGRNWAMVRPLYARPDALPDVQGVRGVNSLGRDSPARSVALRSPQSLARCVAMVALQLPPPSCPLRLLSYLAALQKRLPEW